MEHAIHHLEPSEELVNSSRFSKEHLHHLGPAGSEPDLQKQALCCLFTPVQVQVTSSGWDGHWVSGDSTVVRHSSPNADEDLSRSAVYVGSSVSQLTL
jgi:hypothetical protein